MVWNVSKDSFIFKTMLKEFTATKRVIPGIVTKTIDESQMNHRQLKTSHRQLQTSHRRLQTSHRQLQTSHKLPQTSHRLLTDSLLLFKFLRIFEIYKRSPVSQQTFSCSKPTRETQKSVK